MQPFDYRIAVQNPVAMALAGYQQGQQFQNQRVQAERDAALYGMQMEQFQMQRQKLEQEQARATEVQTALAGIAQRIGEGTFTAEDILSVGLKYPEITEQVTSVYNTLSDIQKETGKKDLARFATALKYSPKDVAPRLVDERIAALENSGKVDEANQLKAIKGMMDINPDAALTSTLVTLSGYMEPDEFKTFSETIMPPDPEAASNVGKIIQDWQNGLYDNLYGSPEEAKAAALRDIEAARTKSPLVQIGGEETEFSKTAGRGQAEGILAVSGQGQTARRNRQTLMSLQGALLEAPTGAEAAIKSALGNLGIPTKGLSDIQAAEALINQLVPAQRPPGSGTMSDRDLALYKASLPRLINTPGGNQKIIDTALAINEYMIREGELADQVLDGTLSREDYRAEIAKLGNPLAEFSSMSNLPVVESDSDYEALPSGAEFVDATDGKRYRKP